MHICIYICPVVNKKIRSLCGEAACARIIKDIKSVWWRGGEMCKVSGGNKKYIKKNINYKKYKLSGGEAACKDYD